MKFLKSVTLAAAAALSCHSVAHATLIYSQDFETLTASNNGTGLNGQGGFTAETSVKVYDTGGVTYTDSTNGLQVAGGQNMVDLNTPTGATNANFGTVSVASQTGTDLYFSFTYNFNNANKATDSGADFFRLQFGNSNSASSINYLGVQVQGGLAATNNLFLARGRSDTNNPGVNTGSGIAFTADGTTAYLVSGKLAWNATNLNYDSITLWINPTATVSDPTAGQYLGTQTAGMTGSLLTAISAINFQNGNTPDNLDSGDSMKLDNFRLGTTFADVAAVAAVPEPGTIGLLTAGLMCGLWGRRRRRVA